MNINLISLMPQLVESTLAQGVVGSAFKKNICQLNAVNPRDFTSDVHQTVDDRPFGGGDGMLMMAEPLQQAYKSLSQPGEVFYLSPQGQTINDAWVKQKSKLSSITLICGRYGGVDQRFLSKNQIKEISIGDYVLSGGELAAGVVIDALVRQIPGVLGHGASAYDDSFKNDLLEAPYFTRPQNWQGIEVPAIFLSGDHKKIQEYKQKLSQITTLLKRPDLIELSSEEVNNLRSFVKTLSDMDLAAMGWEIDVVLKALGENHV